jgi:hypothetical protein
VPRQVLVLPAPLEFGLYREQYETLAEDLEGEGVLVRVVPAGEERGLSRADSTNAAEHYDLQIQVGSSAGAIVGTAKLVEIVRRRLRDREGRGAERVAKIYLANGEELEFSFGGEER